MNDYLKHVEELDRIYGSWETPVSISDTPIGGKKPLRDITSATTGSAKEASPMFKPLSSTLTGGSNAKTSTPVEALKAPAKEPEPPK